MAFPSFITGKGAGLLDEQKEFSLGADPVDFRPGFTQNEILVCFKVYLDVPPAFPGSLEYGLGLGLSKLVFMACVLDV